MMMKSNSTYLSTIFVQCPCGQQRVALLRRNTGPGHTAQHAGKHRKPVPPATHSFHSKNKYERMAMQSRGCGGLESRGAGTLTQRARRMLEVLGVWVRLRSMSLITDGAWR